MHSTVDLKSNTAAFDWTGPQKRIVVVQPDIVLYELTAGGMLEARADWTASARDYIAKDLTSSLGAKSIDVTPLDPLSNQHDIQLVKLHNAVGGEIILHGWGVRSCRPRLRHSIGRLALARRTCAAATTPTTRCS